MTKPMFFKYKTNIPKCRLMKFSASMLSAKTECFRLKWRDKGSQSYIFIQSNKIRKTCYIFWRQCINFETFCVRFALTIEFLKIMLITSSVQFLYEPCDIFRSLEGFNFGMNSETFIKYKWKYPGNVIITKYCLPEAPKEVEMTNQSSRKHAYIILTPFNPTCI